MKYSREAIQKIEGYTPGEQPQGMHFIKLNTNENPYPPSPHVQEALQNFDVSRLRLYSEPSARLVREAAADVWGVKPEQVLVGNGSDDLLTIMTRTFVGEKDFLAYATPSYSLYPVLADLQGCGHRPVELDENFCLPENAAELAGNARLFIFARPNAPTGTLTPMARVKKLCKEFQGIVWIDEAYADFAGENCLDLLKEFPNVVISRTFSKSYSLAGLRLGIAMSSEENIYEMNKVKDSYNIDMLAQYLGAAALRDQKYMLANVAKIRQVRQWLATELSALGCNVLPSASNFLFVQPAHCKAADLFKALRGKGYLVRYFNLPRISGYLRVTMGTENDMQGFLSAWKELDRT